ncbi:hypothetical protein [Butyricicoccus pullicaecorum]|uniref:hypothetical protein n=1 Tax=Butyricicoccus pullicaecorum TaxID=501571 RepID=UPI0039904C5D
MTLKEYRLYEKKLKDLNCFLQGNITSSVFANVYSELNEIGLFIDSHTDQNICGVLSALYEKGKTTFRKRDMTMRMLKLVRVALSDMKSKTSFEGEDKPDFDKLELIKLNFSLEQQRNLYFFIHDKQKIKIQSDLLLTAALLIDALTMGNLYTELSELFYPLKKYEKKRSISPEEENIISKGYALLMGSIVEKVV